MNNTYLKILTPALLCVAGCAQVSPVALQQVGPRVALVNQQINTGILQVYTARERAPINVNAEEFFWNNDFGKNEFLYEPVHTRYVIYTADGQLVQHVRNRTGSNDADPATVVLAPGRYRIEALAEDFSDACSTVVVPVCIDPGMSTTVHLDGRWKPSGPLNENEMVRLPNGSLVGWQSQCQETTHASRAGI
jgi:hypothetical protein